jgi:hypothetical protein
MSCTSEINTLEGSTGYKVTNPNYAWTDLRSPAWDGATVLFRRDDWAASATTYRRP